MSTILGLFLAVKDPPRRLARRPIETAELIADRGLVGDKSFDRRTHRQLNIVQACFYSWFAQSFGKTLPAGSAGENVLVSDELDLNWLPMRSRFRLGSAELELHDYRMPCKHFATVLTPERVHPDDFVGHVGLLCRVVADGRVRLGDRLELLTPTASFASSAVSTKNVPQVSP